MTALDNALSETAAEIERLRQELYRSDVMLTSTAREHRVAAATKASTFVWLSASLEAYVQRTIQYLVAELNVLAVPCTVLRRSLFSLLCAPDFDSLQSKRGLSMWQRRTSVFIRLADPNAAVLNPELLPLDGRTINGDHFETIWQVFGFSGSALPSPRHRLALKDLAEGRNRVAHGEQDPVNFGRQRVYSDVLRLVAHAEDVVEHLAVAVVEYLASEYYLHH
jgi:hypothetical protein